MSAIFAHVQDPTVSGVYRHWDELRHRVPPGDLSHDEWWLGLKFARHSGRKRVPGLEDPDGVGFTYILTDEALSMLHRIDRQAAGRVDVPEPIVSASTRDRYLISSLMEEAISSSLLEGAATTRGDAKQLLRSGREPRSRGERMVVNNYRTMQAIREDLDAELTVEMVLDIHRQVTEGTLDDPAGAGRVQGPDETRVWVDDGYGAVLHRPPPAEQLSRRLQSLTSFANAAAADPFVHPVIRAMILHFWLAYDHPFADGNGRTARALFYRSMLQQGYWLTEFLSISRLLYEAPAKYGRAFLHTETDENDLTYFLLHQMDVLCRSIDDLYAYLERKVTEVRRVESALRRRDGLNHRQFDLLSHALRHPDAIYTIATHARTHSVVYQTARMDLLDLEAMDLLQRQKVGREFRFYPASDLQTRLQA